MECLILLLDYIRDLFKNPCSLFKGYKNSDSFIIENLNKYSCILIKMTAAQGVNGHSGDIVLFKTSNKNYAWLNYSYYTFTCEIEWAKNNCNILKPGPNVAGGEYGVLEIFAIY